MLESLSYYFAQVWYLKAAKIVITFVALWFIGMIGGLDQIVSTLLTFMCLDFTLGLASSYRDDRLSYGRLKTWIYKFILYAVAIIVGHLTDILIFHSIIEFGFKNAIVVYLGVIESLSVIKHLKHFGVPFPQKIIKALENFRDHEINITH